MHGAVSPFPSTFSWPDNFHVFSLTFKHAANCKDFVCENLIRLYIPDAVFFACSDVTEMSEHVTGEVVCPPHQWP
jgi:hypothetical protein